MVLVSVHFEGEGVEAIDFDRVPSINEQITHGDDVYRVMRVNWFTDSSGGHPHIYCEYEYTL